MKLHIYNLDPIKSLIRYFTSSTIIICPTLFRCSRVGLQFFSSALSFYFEWRVVISTLLLHTYKHTDLGTVHKPRGQKFWIFFAFPPLVDQSDFLYQSFKSGTLKKSNDAIFKDKQQKSKVNMALIGCLGIPFLSHNIKCLRCYLLKPSYWVILTLLRLCNNITNEVDWRYSA